MNNTCVLDPVSILDLLSVCFTHPRLYHGMEKRTFKVSRYESRTTNMICICMISMIIEAHAAVGNAETHTYTSIARYCTVTNI